MTNKKKTITQIITINSKQTNVACVLTHEFWNLFEFLLIEITLKSIFPTF
jgi:hypothetical protein